jgi:hypothetical protein
VRGGNVGDPIPHGFTDGVFQGAAAGSNADDFGAEQAHAEDVQALAAHVFFAHINRAIETEEGADAGGGNTVLTGSGFGDDAVFIHAAGEQGLAETVVDFVRAGVEQVFPLEINARTAELLREALGVVERSGATGIGVQQVIEFLLERLVLASGEVGSLELFQGRHEDFGDLASAIGAKVAAGIGLSDGWGQAWFKARGWHAFRNRARRAGSFLPGVDSSDELASMPQGWACSMA